MAYRPPRPAAAYRGSGARRQPSSAARIAIARATGRRQKSGSAVGWIIGLIASTLVVIIATSVLGAGVGVSATLLKMQSDLAATPVDQFEQLTYAQPTTVWDRTNKIELAKFQQERREVVTFDQIPHLMLDATVATEDKTFWTNPGYDPQAIVRSALLCLGGNCASGASTITQQFVRARLLPRYMLASGFDDKQRKVYEILQSASLTDYVTKNYGEQGGKERIITAYMNQIFYGHNAYGVAGAAATYFGKALNDLTPAEAATLAAIPKSPVCYDLYSWLPKDENGGYIKDAQGRLVVPITGAVPPTGCEAEHGTTSIIDRRNSILHDMALGADPHTGQGFGRWTSLTADQLQTALAEPIVLVGDQPTVFKAPHFVWAMKSQLDQFLADRAPAESGGYHVVTTLDMPAQALAERYVTAATILPQLSVTAFNRAIAQRNPATGKALYSADDKIWIRNLRGHGIHNGALVAQNYSNGDILAYVGSAGYYRDDLASAKFNPKYDVAGQGFRQPGSAFKPIVYTTGYDERKITPGTVLLDITTPFARDWTPKDADLFERGPVLARKALQYSLNIPAIRALDRIGPATVDQAAKRGGLDFAPGTSIARAGLAGAIGTVEVHLNQLVSMYGGFGNGGVVNEPRMILDVQDSDGNSIWNDTAPHSHNVWSPQAAWLMANILEGNTNPQDNSIWGPRFRLDNGPNGAYRPAGLKTGTTNDVRDVSAYGLLAKPTDDSQPAIALGVWMGNSDHTPPNNSNAVIFASDGPGELWHSWMREFMKGKPVTDFERPKGLVQATIDSYSGGKPGPWTRGTVDEWFINGTQPGGQDAVDPAGVLYTQICGQWMVDPAQAENKGAPSTWIAADTNWARRAMRGPGIGGPDGTRTAYFFHDRTSWGGPITDGTNCSAPTPTPGGTSTPGNGTPPPDATPTPDQTQGPTPVPTCRNSTHPHGCVGGNDQATRPPLITPPPAAAAAGAADAVPGDEAEPATATADADTFGVIVKAVAPAAPPSHPLPIGILGSFVQGIVGDPVATAPVRVGRRRRVRSSRR
jgi:membrane peptidoglycan carboxypeptidase